MRRALFAVAIGPVSDLIAAGRKTRDLSYGSWMLSECSKAAARFLKGRGCELIFPYSTENFAAKLEPYSRFAVVNKILAWADGEEASFKELANECKATVNGWLSDELKKVNERIPAWKDRLIAYDQDSATKQIGEVMEFYAAWAYYDASLGADAYKVCRAEADRRLAGRKALRTFSKHVGSSRPKSSLDGNRETVIEHRGKKDEYRKFYIPPGELLDALGILKRVGRTPNHDQRFDSTHDVAAAPFVKRLKAKTERRALLEAYDLRMQELKRADVATPSYSYIYHTDELYERIRDVVDPIRALHPVTPYYGILVGDGDFMGATLSKIGSAERHREFSSTLSTFAELVRARLDALGAEPVFAGGDDVVAFLPLDIAIECMKEVNRIFTETMSKFPGVSFSAGMAVCHAMDPLAESVEAAREAEKAAKKVDGKAALGITVVPRSGTDVKVAGKWALLDRIDSIAKLYEGRELTLSLAHEFRGLLAEWVTADEGTLKALDAQLEAMAMAIARKKRSSKAAQDLIEKSFKDAMSPRQALGDLTQCLYVARPFARAQREAGGGA